MLSRIKGLFIYERETPSSLFVVRNIIEGENDIKLPPGHFLSRSFERTGADKILEIMSSSTKPLSSSELLAACLSSRVCSRATFFRKLRELVDEGKVDKIKKGKNCFYTVSG